MKYVKMLGIAALAAMAFTAFAASTASASILWHKSAGGVETTYTGSLISSLASGGTANLTSTSDEPIVTCSSSSVEGSVTKGGSATETASGPVSHLTFSGGCSVTVEQSKNGSLEVHHIAGTTNGTVTGTGFYVIVHSPFVGACNYGLGTGKHDLGTLTGNTNGAATLHVNTNVTEQEPKRLLCPDTTKWVATYDVTSPANLWVEAGK